MELTLHNGDCLEIMKSLPDKSIDLIICDLPYGCLNAGYRTSGIHPQSTNPNQNPSRTEFKTEACAWDIKIDLEAFWKQVKRIRKSDHSPTIHFCTTKFGYELIQSNPSEFRYDLVWDKQRGVSFLSANKMPMRSHEMIYVFSKAGAYYNRMDISGNFRPSQGGGKGSNVYNTKASDKYKGTGSTTTRCVVSVIQTHTSAKKGQHPTEKPSELYKWLIERYCPVGGTVLDPTFGSGNSVFQAFAMGRSAIGIEKDDKFFKKAEEKLNALP
jgi:site-specific DNA-methyltransferase (adenine-specific)